MDNLNASTESSNRFFKLPIELNDHTYNKGYVDKIHAQLVAEHLKVGDNQNDDFTLVAPNDPSLLITLSILSLLEILRYDIAMTGKQTLDDLKPGDSAGLIQDRFMFPGIFMGTEEMHGRKYYVVKRVNGGMTEKIPEGEREWRIQPYSATDDLVASKKRGKVYGKALEDLLELPTGGLKTFQKSKIIVVPNDKRLFIDQLRSTKVGGDSLETIFPIAEYTTVSDWHYIGQFGANNIKQQPALGIVSNADVAVDIALKDPDVKVLLLSGSSKIRRNFGSIERLNYDESPRKIISLLEPTEEEELKTLHSLGIESWIWKRDDFKEVDPEEVDQDSPFYLHDTIYRKLAYSEVETIEVDLPEHVELSISKIYKSFFSLAKNMNPLPDSGLLIRWGLGLVNNILQMPCTINDYDEFVRSEIQEDKTILGRFSKFKERLVLAHGYLIPSTHITEAQELIHEIESLISYFQHNSPKEEVLKQRINDEYDAQRKIAVFTPTSNLSAMLSRTYKSEVITANMERVDSIPSDVALVIGWSNRKNVARTFLAPSNKIIWILYKRESRNVKSVYQNHPASPSSDFDSQLRARMGFVNTDKQHEVTTVEGDNDIPTIDELLHSFSERFGNSEISQQDFDNENSRTGETVDAVKITLSDESHVYVDADHRLDKIDTVNNKLERCAVSKLQEGDELVFAETERDMFEELLGIMQESDEYRNLFEQATVWRTSLQDYMERTDTDESQLVAMFKLLQYPKDINVIRSWTRGKVIGPTGDNYAAIPVIEKITQDPRMIGKSAEIIHAIKAIHALHIQTGYLLVRNIVNSSVAEISDVNAETRERLERYSASTRLRTIVGISDYTIPMDIRRIGKLESSEV